MDNSYLTSLGGGDITQLVTQIQKQKQMPTHLGQRFHVKSREVNNRHNRSISYNPPLSNYVKNGKDN